MGKHYPKMQCSITIAMLSIFGARTKNSVNWCAQQGKGIPSITANLILLTLYFLLKLTHFLVNSTF